jgi:hypothetical protein
MKKMRLPAILRNELVSKRVNTPIPTVLASVTNGGPSAQVPMAVRTTPRTAFKICRIEGSHLRAQNSIQVRETGDQETVAVPYGMEKCVVSALTFKALMKAKPKDTLLRSAGNSWVIVPDDACVDLADRTVLYRIGILTVAS